jgi:hypothetical protein
MTRNRFFNTFVKFDIKQNFPNLCLSFCKIIRYAKVSFWQTVVDVFE